MNVARFDEEDKMLTPITKLKMFLRSLETLRPAYYEEQLVVHKCIVLLVQPGVQMPTQKVYWKRIINENFLSFEIMLSNDDLRYYYFRDT